MTDKENWRPQGVFGWLLTVVACLLAVIMAGLAYCMAYPVRWDGPGKLGAVALFFPSICWWPRWWPRCWPSSSGGRPAILFVHGGAWTHGNRSMLPDWNTWLNKLGFEVFDVEYRLAPPVRWLDQIGDVKCALGWVAAHAGRISYRPGAYQHDGRLGRRQSFHAGRLQHGRPATDSVLQRCTNCYGPLCRQPLRPGGPGLRLHPSGSLSYVQNALKQYIGGSPADYPDRYRVVSPVSHIGPNTPPTITIIGTSDRIIPVHQAFVLDQALSKAGVAHETYLLPANDHGFDVNWGGFGTQIARAKIKDFLKRY